MKSKEDALEYCRKKRDSFIKDAYSINRGIKMYDCLITLLEKDSIKPEEVIICEQNYPNK